MVIRLDLIELDDKGTPEALAAEIVRQNPDVTLPIPVEEIAQATGILRVEPLRSEAFEGMLISNPEKSEGVIFVNQNRPRQRQRFTIGHEIGHFLLPWHRHMKDGALKFECTAEDMRAYRNANSDRRADWEGQANEFSSELLMPRGQFKLHMNGRGEPHLLHVQELSVLFDTSVEATARRYVALSDYPIAIVFAQGRQVRHAWKSPEFRYFLDVKKGSSLPKVSQSIADGRDESVADFECIDSHWWLNADRGRRPPSEILEQTLYQRDGYRVILLYADVDGDDDDQ